MRAWLGRHRMAIVALLGYGAVTAVYLRALLARLGDHVLDNGDVLFNLTVVSWVADRVPHGLAGVWDAPWFFPTRHALALSDHLIGPGTAMALLRPWVGGEVAAHNLLFFLAFALGGWTAWLLLRRLGLSPLAAFAGGAVWSFLPFRWEQANHLQVLLAAAVPLLLLAFHRLLADPTWRRGAAFLAVYAAHVSGGTYLAVMAHVPLAVLLALALPGLLRRRAEARVWAVLLATAGACAVVTGALLLPYRAAAGMGLIRREQDWSTWGATVLSLLQPGEASRWQALFPSALRRPENSLFPGVVAGLLALAGLLLRREDETPRPDGGRHPARTLLLALGAGLLVTGLLLGDLRTWLGLDRVPALGGTIGLRAYARPAQLVLAGVALLVASLWRRLGRARAAEPLAFDLLAASAVTLLLAFPALFENVASKLPGFAGMRVPTRFFVFTSLGLAALAGRGLDALRERLPASRPARLLPGLLLLLLLVEAAPQALAWRVVPPREAPGEVAAWLRDEPTVRAVVHLPLPAAADVDLEIARMWSALAHGRPIANGYSGQFPPSYRALQRSFFFLPPAGEPATLAAAGLSHLVVEWDRVPATLRSDLYHWLAAREAAGSLRVVFERDGVLIYALAPSMPPAPPG